ncbi:MAG: alpha/beta hydrolase [Lachnospiraceae bacterium]|nr:alpha/beta hydrolase [Lachnospiraceae bacterium]
MALSSKKNQNLMNVIKKVHSVVENQNLEKQRQNQDNLGAIWGKQKEIDIRSINIQGMYAEWVGVNRSHMKKYVILYCHGGGYMTGSSMYARTLTTKLAATTSMDVLCFDYRLSPEHPYPAALEDAVKAWDYLMLLGYGARNVIVAGDSAGGNLALCLVHCLKREERLIPKGLVLMSPWTDLLTKGKSHETRASLDPVLDAEYLELATKSYAEGEELTNPFISPLYGDFRGFPRTHIQVGDNEILLNDSTMLYKAMLKANVPVEIEIYKGMWHVFQMSPFKTAYDAMDQNAEFIYEICR